jgi:hypothetical protein
MASYEHGNKDSFYYRGFYEAWYLYCTLGARYRTGVVAEIAKRCLLKRRDGVQHSCVYAKRIHHGFHPEGFLCIHVPISPHATGISKKDKFLQFWMARNGSPQDNPHFVRDGR